MEKNIKPSWQLRVFNCCARFTIKPLFHFIAHEKNLNRQTWYLQRVRRSTDFMYYCLLRLQRRLPETVTFNNVAGRWFGAESTNKKIILYVHGGAYAIGSSLFYAPLCARLAALTNCRVFAPDYRLLPENLIMDAINDVCASYRGLLQAGFKPENIIIAGDSAGAGLAVASLLALREQGEALPAACVLLSPWLDPTFSGASIRDNAQADPMIVIPPAIAYFANQDFKHPYLLPLAADLHGLPPFLIQVGSSEVLLDDAQRFAAHAMAAGVTTELEIWNQTPHVWQRFAAVLPEGRAALHAIADFIAAIFKN